MVMNLIPWYRKKCLKKIKQTQEDEVTVLGYPRKLVITWLGSMGYITCLYMGYIRIITYLLTIDPNFQRDIQVDTSWLQPIPRNPPELKKMVFTHPGNQPTHSLATSRLGMTLKKTKQGRYHTKPNKNKHMASGNSL